MKKLLNFSLEGRLRRRDFWVGKIAMFTLTILLFGIGIALDEFIGGSASAVLFLMILIFVGLYTISYSIRRLHDLDTSGWWLLLQLIPFVGQIQFLILLFANGTVGQNKFGADPKNQGEFI
jgi:uncharacterized membrane protein YhaH (DUF805 family)